MKTITQEELDKKLKLHELWLDDNTQGVRLDLSGLDLKRADLEGADLQYAILNDANLYFSDLTDANLTDADLTDANTTHIRGLKVLSLDNIGTFKGKVTYIPKLDKVFAGCWKGSLEGFLKQGLEMNKENDVELQNIRLAYQFFKNNSPM